MPINEIIEGAVKDISEAIDRRRPDVAALRQDLAERAGHCLSAIQLGDVGRDSWLNDADADTIAFSPMTVDDQPIVINGKTTTFWPKADAAAPISRFRDAVTLGEFDDQLLSGGQPGISPKIEGEQIPVDPDNGSMTTGGGRTSVDEVDSRFTEHLGIRTEPSNE